MQQALPLKTHRWVYAFILTHVFCWTLVPFLVRYNLPLDSIEGTIWGHQLEWGYDKNPFLNGWLTALAVYIDRGSGWMIYCFSQLSVAACLWVVWQLGKQMLTPIYAAIAVMLLEGMQYFNFHAIDFNDNTLELGLWALTIYFFYQALHTTKISAWIFTGFFAAFAMMAKYYTAALLATMFLLLVLRADDRRQLKTSAPYFGLLAFLIIIAPHLVWLFSHDFITIKYVFGRAKNIPHWTNHFFFPMQFAWQQFEVFLPSLLLFGLLCIGKPRFGREKEWMTSGDSTFLWAIALGPLLLTLLLSLCFGITLRAGWGMPLLSFCPLLLLFYIRPRLTVAKCYAFFATVYLLLTCLLVGYSYSLIYSSTPSSANFPGQTIASAITEKWRDTFNTPLSYVAGSRWIGGNVSFYSKDHPSVFIEWNKQKAPWVNMKDLASKGAVFIWDISENETLPEDIIKQFPQLSRSFMLKFKWLRDKNSLPAIKIGVAFLPPENALLRGKDDAANQKQDARTTPIG